MAEFSDELFVRTEAVASEILTASGFRKAALAQLLSKINTLHLKLWRVQNLREEGEQTKANRLLRSLLAPLTEIRHLTDPFLTQTTQQTPQTAPQVQE